MSLSERDNIFMKRCIDLAQLGLGYTAPNPMVGSVIVYNDRIIGEGYHKKYGEAHAEVNAIKNVKDKSLLKKSVLYVNLEPCSHTGKTPPCSDLIIDNQIPEVVIGTTDPNSLVQGKGIQKLKNAGIQVKQNILPEECFKLNKRFFTFHEKKRPYIIFKWAQSADGYIDIERSPDTPVAPNWISNKLSRQLVHKWRGEEQAIMVGTNTVLFDNPRLDQRLSSGKSPVRIIIDRKNKIPADFNVMDGSVETIIFTENIQKPSTNIEFIEIEFDKHLIQSVLSILHDKEIQSVIIEGGKQIIESFYEQNMWDEARVFVGKTSFGNGVKAPELNLIPSFKQAILNDLLIIYKNKK